MGKTFKDKRRWDFKNGFREFKESIRDGTFVRDLSVRYDKSMHYDGWTGKREGHGKYGDDVRYHFLDVKQNGYNDEIE